MLINVHAVPPHQVPRLDERGQILANRFVGYGPDGSVLKEGEEVFDHPLVRKALRLGLLTQGEQR